MVAKGAMGICTAHRASTPIMQTTKALEYVFTQRPRFAIVQFIRQDEGLVNSTILFLRKVFGIKYYFSEHQKKSSLTLSTCLHQLSVV